MKEGEKTDEKSGFLAGVDRERCEISTGETDKMCRSMVQKCQDREMETTIF